ncbi:MAC/perforin domain-containing protein [Mucilaginibacter auburnensis]|uniref:MAC/Perforin domain-containing protein n=1 Tax=Mucilaginibacter auburnensis TaxID=1457233 RepID=A0A2H9VT96_9SPHI|nr:MAC/perforin domain-containing protein [Mucilaginibacter auburnensis]PJJ84029.1 MAC/Perforin domain-containing protein [Mucilaginibacter auburnensis]
MKKLFIPFLLLFTIFASCKKTSIENSPTPKLDSASKPPKLATMSSGDGVHDLLGYGYDVTGVYANPISSKFSVIDVARLKADFPTRVESQASTLQDLRLVAGENAQSYLKNLATNVSSSLTLGIFKGSISGSFSDNESFSSKYVYSSFNLIIHQKILRLNASYSILKQYLQPTFEYDIQHNTPEAIVASYGTHVLSDFVLGAKLEALYRSETKKFDRTTAAKAGVDVGIKAIFSINTGYNYSANDTYDNYSQTLNYKTYGGDPTKSLVGSITIGQPVSGINIADWQGSATPQNSQLVDINQGGLIPIYELIDDPAKKAAVMTYVNQYLAANQVNVTPVPIHMFFQTSQVNHVYTANYNDYPYTQNGFVYLGEAFKAYASQIDGTQPVHVFFHPTQKNHLYTINRFDYPYEQNGFTYMGVNFYAYPTQVAGSVAVHCYFSNSQKNHVYTINKYDYPYEANGYAYLGIAFYAKPN